jgi:phosphotransferase system  glucose/maltose/N-acetylglucosamine-specific IIC component
MMHFHYKNTISVFFWKALEWKIMVNSGHWEYFTTIWYVGIFYGLLVYFVFYSRFGIFQEKSGNLA